MQFRNSSKHASVYTAYFLLWLQHIFVQMEVSIEVVTEKGTGRSHAFIPLGI